MQAKSLSVVCVLTFVMLASVFLLYISLTIINTRDDLPLPTKILLAELRKAKEDGNFINSTLPIRCIKQKLNLTRMSLEIKTKEKPNEVLLARAKAAYQISTFPCLKLLTQISEFNKTRNGTDEKNETYVECFKTELKKLKPNSLILKDFRENPDEEENCQLISDFMIEPEKSQLESFYNSSQLKKCKLDEFLQLDKLKIKLYEEYLVPTMNMTDKFTFDRFKMQFSLNVHAMADKQIKCIFKEVY